jgi:hypothetical protein
MQLRALLPHIVIFEAAVAARMLRAAAHAAPGHVQPPRCCAQQLCRPRHAQPARLLAQAPRPGAQALTRPRRRALLHPAGNANFSLYFHPSPKDASLVAIREPLLLTCKQAGSAFHLKWVASGAAACPARAAPAPAHCHARTLSGTAAPTPWPPAPQPVRPAPARRPSEPAHPPTATARPPPAAGACRAWTCPAP